MVNSVQNISKLGHLKSIATLLDSKFKGPFGTRFGIDAILGLVPFVGDFATTGFSLYILIQSANLGCSPSTIIRMALNIGIDNIFSAIPVLGNVFDFIWKSNTKNLALLESHLANPKSVIIRSRLILIAVLIVLVSFLALTGYLTFYIFKEIFEWISTLH